MIKTIGYLFIGILAFIVFFTPARNFMNNLLHKDKAELREGQVIGSIDGYNPRVEEIQEILQKAGFEPGSLDGRMGAQTRAAIRKFQKEKGLRANAKIDSATYLALKREKEDAANILKAEHLNSDDREVMREAGSEKTKIQDEVLSYRLESQDRAKQIQSALKNAGFYQGPIDGKIGHKTKEAIIKFQKANGLKADGIVGKRTSAELNKHLSR